MKALVYTEPGNLEIQDADNPNPGNDKILVGVAAVGICGSDMHAYQGHDGRRPPPLILGHEAAGTVLSGPSEGSRVTINPLVTCGECTACLEGRDNLCADRKILSIPPQQGAFCEQIAIPQKNTVTIPGELCFEKASLAEPLACSYHAVRLAAEASQRPLAESCTVVLGGGAIGLGAALCLHDQGCSDIWIAETNITRHAILDAAGDFNIYNPANQDGPHPHSAHLVIDAFGGPATRAAASQLIRPGGVIIHIGLAGGEGGLDTRMATLQEITFMGSYTYTMSDFRHTVDAIAQGRLGALDWYETRPLSDGQDAFQDIENGDAAAPKIILQP